MNWIGGNCHRKSTQRTSFPKDYFGEIFFVQLIFGKIIGSRNKCLLIITCLNEVEISRISIALIIRPKYIISVPLETWSPHQRYSGLLYQQIYSNCSFSVIYLSSNEISLKFYGLKNFVVYVPNNNKSSHRVVH